MGFSCILRIIISGIEDIKKGIPDSYFGSIFLFILWFKSASSSSDSFCFLLYSSWLLVFILYVFELFFSFINLYCWKGLHFSWSNFLFFIFIIIILNDTV